MVLIREGYISVKRDTESTGSGMEPETNVSKCANPECDHEFRRLGEGRLFVRPAEKSASGITQKALWLCSSCAEHLELRFDRREQQYHLVHRRRIA